MAGKRRADKSLTRSAKRSPVAGSGTTKMGDDKLQQRNRAEMNGNKQAVVGSANATLRDMPARQDTSTRADNLQRTAVQNGRPNLPTFEGLPPELRNPIYENVLGSEVAVDLSKKPMFVLGPEVDQSMKPRFTPQIMLVSKGIRAESLSVYAQHHFIRVKFDGVDRDSPTQLFPVSTNGRQQSTNPLLFACASVHTKCAEEFGRRVATTVTMTLSAFCAWINMLAAQWLQGSLDQLTWDANIFQLFDGYHVQITQPKDRMFTASHEAPSKTVANLLGDLQTMRHPRIAISLESDLHTQQAKNISSPATMLNCWRTAEDVLQATTTVCGRWKTALDNLWALDNGKALQQRLDVCKEYAVLLQAMVSALHWCDSQPQEVQQSSRREALRLLLALACTTSSARTAICLGKVKSTLKSYMINTSLRPVAFPRRDWPPPSWASSKQWGDWRTLCTIDKTCAYAEANFDTVDLAGLRDRLQTVKQQLETSNDDSSIVRGNAALPSRLNDTIGVVEQVIQDCGNHPIGSPHDHNTQVDASVFRNRLDPVYAIAQVYRPDGTSYKALAASTAGIALLPLSCWTYIDKFANHSPSDVGPAEVSRMSK